MVPDDLRQNAIHVLLAHVSSWILTIQCRFVLALGINPVMRQAHDPVEPPPVLLVDRDLESVCGKLQGHGSPGVERRIQFSVPPLQISGLFSHPLQIPPRTVPA